MLCTDDHLQETSPLYFMFSMNYFNLSVARVNLHIGRSTSVFRPSLRKPSSLIWSKGQNHSTKVHNASWKRRGFYSFSTRGLSNAFYIVKMSGWVTSCNSPVVNWHRAAKTETIFARRSNLNAKDWAWRVVEKGRVRSNSWQ